ELGKDGYNIAIMDLNAKEQCQDNLKLLDDNGIDYIYLEGNICKALDRQRIIEETVAKFGGIQVLVNNAGVAPASRADLLEMTEESFDRVVGINTKGTMFMTQSVANQMIVQELINGKRGNIINISSCSAEVSSTGRGEYCVSKAGVSMLTTLYADRLAREAIFVNEVRPGVIATDMTSTVKAKYDKMFADGVFPIARWGTAEDIAGVVSALCSDKFNYTTGIYIDVDGGFHIKRL
ncbi:MAG: 3-ketoacyl-ACP reductase, partial [Clostridia bacterium]